MAFWYFVIGFVASAVAFFVINAIRFVRHHYNKNLSVLEVIKLVTGPANAAPSNEASTSVALAPVENSTVAITPVEESKAAPAEAEPEVLSEPERPVADPLDMAAFSRRLTRSADPIAELKDFVRQTRAAEAAQTCPHHADSDANPAPDALSLYLVRGLEEAGLLDSEAKFPAITVVRPSRSKSFYLRVGVDEMSWGDYLRMIGIEGALNRALFAWEHLVKDAGEDEESPSLEELYCFNQALSDSITAQLGSESISHASMSDFLGEWGVRQAIASGIESFRVPLRLTARFRLNLMGGDAAIVASFVPAAAQPHSVYSAELDRVIEATSTMRERAATDYALRCALLLASHAFRCSKRLCHVFVAFTMDTPAHHVCVLSGDISREALREYDLSKHFDAEQVCRELGVRFELKDEALQEIEQGFSLDSERFCPRTRYEAVDLSERILPRFEAMLLGANKVSDLAINENAHRDEVAQQLVRMLTGSTTKDVHRILELTQNDKDKTVQEAGKRLVAQLIDGTLSDNDTYALTQEFVFGDELTRACERALDLLNEDEPQEAADILTDALAPIDALDVYADTNEVNWREFTSYVGRALYNRLLANEGAEVRLVPDSYYSAQLLQASAQIMLGRPDVALGFAERARDLNPLDMSALLRIVRALEVKGELAAASDELMAYLEIAFDPNAIGTCYYRLAYLQWHLGNIELADACYQKALTTRTPAVMPAMIELQMLRLSSGSKSVKPDDVEAILEEAGIPLAPTEQVTDVLIEAAQAATDAEVFPVARSFATLLGSLSGDDVMHDIASSIEREPDR